MSVTNKGVRKGVGGGGVKTRPSSLILYKNFFTKGD